MTGSNESRAQPTVRAAVERGIERRQQGGDRLALAHAIEDAGIERAKAEALVTAIDLFVKDNAATVAAMRTEVQPIQTALQLLKDRAATEHDVQAIGHVHRENFIEPRSEMNHGFAAQHAEMNQGFAEQDRTEGALFDRSRRPAASR